MDEPRVDRPHVPGYGIPRSTKGVLPWSWVVQRLERAEVYWLATADADGAPHLIPIWGAWVDGRWYVEGGPTRWQRNLRANPRMAIHVESTSREVVIVEGTAIEIVAPAEGQAERILAGYGKYPARIRGGSGQLGTRRTVGVAPEQGVCLDHVPERHDAVFVRCRGIGCSLRSPRIVRVSFRS